MPKEKKFLPKKDMLAKGSTTNPAFQETPLSDNLLFGLVMRQADLAKNFLEELLGCKIARIEFIDREVDITDSLFGHGIRMDVYLEDAAGTVYNIEMQNRTDALEQRILYYQAGIVRRLLERGQIYESMSRSYIIFVCNFDYYKRGRARYTKKSIVEEEPDLEYVDSSRVIILNACYRKAEGVTDGILEFLDYIRDNDESVPAKTKLGQQVRALTNQVRQSPEKEVQYMTVAQYVRDERQAARLEERKALVCNNLASGVITLDTAVKLSGADEKTVRAWMHQLHPDYRFDQQAPR